MEQEQINNEIEFKDDLIKGIYEKQIITEKEIKLILLRLNSNKYTYDDVKELIDLNITEEQTAKGLKWLKNKGETPRGIRRKNSPFGYKEEKAIDTFKEFKLNSFTRRGMANYWTPVYDVIGEIEGFQYVVENGTASIIG